MYACEPVKENCWNFYESYGEICVHCGCCSDNLRERYEERIRVLKWQIENNKQFLEDQKDRANVSPDYYWCRNARSSVRYCKSEIKHYRKLLSRLR